jgi:hypothetical protein
MTNQRKGLEPTVPKQTVVPYGIQGEYAPIILDEINGKIDSSTKEMID